MGGPQSLAAYWRDRWPPIVSSLDWAASAALFFWLFGGEFFTGGRQGLQHAQIQPDQRQHQPFHQLPHGTETIGFLQVTSFM